MRTQGIHRNKVLNNINLYIGNQPGDWANQIIYVVYFQKVYIDFLLL